MRIQGPERSVFRGKRKKKSGAAFQRGGDAAGLIKEMQSAIAQIKIAPVEIAAQPGIQVLCVNGFSSFLLLGALKSDGFQAAPARFCARRKTVFQADGVACGKIPGICPAQR